MSDPVVKIEDGLVEGKIEKDKINGEKFYSFEGIPYGEAPVGKLRFKPPVPVKPWDGIKKAKNRNNNGSYRIDVDLAVTENGPTVDYVRKGKEDCLNLNVYTKELKVDSSNLKPVMVFIHGGAFIAGCTQQYGPHFLMSKDIVFISIHYRLGIFGFLVLEDPTLNVTGNAALKDVVLALKWVQNNVHHFNGDKNNVTIFGESAGSATVSNLILSPMAKGLFHKAIMQSGSCLNHWALGSNSNGKKVAKALNCPFNDDAGILQFLQDLPLEILYDGQIKLKEICSPSVNRNFAPVVENPEAPEPFLVEQPLQLLKSGKFNQVPIITGFNSLEGAGVCFFPPLKTLIWKTVEDGHYCPFQLGYKPGSKEFLEIEEKIKKFYFKNQEPTNLSLDSWLYLSDSSFTRDIIKEAKYLAANSQAPVFVYRLSATTKLGLLSRFIPIDVPGVSHADDLGYLFSGIMDISVEKESLENVVRERLLTLWTGFAKNGFPPHELWKATNKKISLLDIGESLNFNSLKEEAPRVDFWDNIFGKE